MPIRLTGTASVGISVARTLPKNREHDQHHEDERLDQRLLHFVDRVLHEGGRIVGDLPGQIVGKTLLQFGKLVAHRFQRRDRVRAGRLIDGEDRRGPAIETCLPVETGGAQLQPGHVAEAQHGAVRVGADNDFFEVLDRIEASLGLDIQLELLVVRDRPRADSPDWSLYILRLDRFDDIAGGQS